jgi:hypothetical protein
VIFGVKKKIELSAKTSFFKIFFHKNAFLPTMGVLITFIFQRIVRGADAKVDIYGGIDEFLRHGTFENGFKNE